MRRILATLTMAALAVASLQAAPMGTAFTYQGKLNDGGASASGWYDFYFKLFTGPGNADPQVGLTLTNTMVLVTNGLLEVKLDFGNQFPGDARWLEIWANTNNQPVVKLDPRQELTPQPYAIFAGTAATVTNQAITTVQLAPGAVTAPQLATITPPSPGQVLAYSPTGLVWTTSSGPLAWLLSGNGGTISTNNFLGTTDNQALEVRVNNTRALRIEPNATSPSLIAGHPANSAPGSIGAVIGGGGSAFTPNNATGAFFGVIGGGQGNANQTVYAVLGGGYGNVAGGWGSVLSGGVVNQAWGRSSTVAGGMANVIGSASDENCTIGGGTNNTASGSASLVAGGEHNSASAHWASVGGGTSNAATNDNSTVGGGQLNHAYGLSSTVAGGYSNAAKGQDSAISGGSYNTVQGDYSVIAGGQSHYVGTNIVVIPGVGTFTNYGRYAFIGGGNGNHAYGDQSAIAGGQANTAQSDYGFIGGGLGNIAGGGQSAGAPYAAVLGGNGNSALASASVVLGGQNNTAAGQNNIAMGADALAVDGMDYGAGRFASPGDAQAGLYLLKGTSTGTTQLTLSGARLGIPMYAGWAFDILVTARGFNDVDGGYQIKGMIRNYNGATAFIGTPTVTTLGETHPAMDVQVTADDATDRLLIKVTGIAGENIRWVASVRTVEVTY